MMVHSGKCCFVNLFVLQSCAMWINPILQDMLRHIFQSCILESNDEILELIQKVCCTTEQLNKKLHACVPACVIYAHFYFSNFSHSLLNVAVSPTSTAERKKNG